MLEKGVHPEPLRYLCHALWSINERLGGGEGAVLDLLADDWVTDTYLIVKRQAEQMEEAKEEMEQEVMAARAARWD